MLLFFFLFYVFSLCVGSIGPPEYFVTQESSVYFKQSFVLFRESFHYVFYCSCTSGFILFYTFYTLLYTFVSALFVVCVTE